MMLLKEIMWQRKLVINERLKSCIKQRQDVKELVNTGDDVSGICIGFLENLRFLIMFLSKKHFT